MLLIERGANPNLAAGGNGATPLWAAVNAQWQPRTRYPQPQEMEQQKATYLDVMKALLAKGADPDARTQDASLVSGLQRLRQSQLRPRRHRRIDRLLARGLRHRSGRDEAAGRLRRRSRTSRPMAPQRRRCAAAAADAPAGACRRRRSRRRAAADPARSSTPLPVPAGGPGRARRSTRPPASSTAKASPATPIVMRRTRGWR